MAFDSKNYEENEKRKVIAKKILQVPWQVQQFFVELLTVQGKRSDYFQTCITCDHFNKEKELCQLANLRPPAQVIADGCESYVDNDEIPF